MPTYHFGRLEVSKTTFCICHGNVLNHGCLVSSMDEAMDASQRILHIP